MKQSVGAKTLATPTPVWLVGTYDAEGKPNIMTVAWGGICCSTPPCVTVSLRRATYSYAAIEARKAFTVSIPSETPGCKGRLRRHRLRARYGQVRRLQLDPGAERPGGCALCGRSAAGSGVPPAPYLRDRAAYPVRGGDYGRQGRCLGDWRKRIPRHLQSQAADLGLGSPGLLRCRHLCREGVGDR